MIESALFQAPATCGYAMAFDDPFRARRAQLRDLFSRMMEAFGRKDFDALANFLREDTVFEWPYLPLKDFPAVTVGKAKFLQGAKAGMADSDPYAFKITRMYDQVEEDTLIAEYTSSTVYHPLNRAYGNSYLGILRFESDQVVYWKEYLNPLAVIEAHGMDFKNTAIEA